MKKLRLLFLLTVIVAACSKNSDGNTKPYTGDPCDRIVTASFESSVGYSKILDTVIYDNQGRVKSVTAEGVTAEYLYYKDSIVIKNNTPRSYIAPHVYYLDNLQRIKRIDGLNEDFTYNADGYMVSYKVYSIDPAGKISYFATNYLEYKDGNLVKDSFPSPYDTIIRYYEYNNQANQILLGFNANPGLGETATSILNVGGYFGRQSKNLPVKFRYKDKDQDVTYDIGYNYDIKGRITARQGYVAVTYQCP